MADKLDFDPYELLALQDGCSEQEVIKAYRKKALQWHPDKNPTQKENAKQMFLKVSKALEILCDPAAKAALDRLRAARRLTIERNRHLDSKRKKLKEELEAREFGVVKTTSEEVAAAERLAAEIERLRTEGSELLQRERENVETLLRTERLNKRSHSDSNIAAKIVPSDAALIKVQWTDPQAAYDGAQLRSVFEKFGEVVSVVLSLRKKLSAVVEFATIDSAKLAVDHSSSKKGFPFTVSLLCDKLKKMNVNSSADQDAAEAEHSGTDQQNVVRNREWATVNSEEADFEALVLKKMRQAQERKNIIAATKTLEQA